MDKKHDEVTLSPGGWVVLFSANTLRWVSRIYSHVRGWVMHFWATTFPNTLAHPPYTYWPVPNSYTEDRKEMLKNGLTAVIFVGAIATVFRAITNPFVGYASPTRTGKLVWLARLGSCGKSHHNCINYSRWEVQSTNLMNLVNYQYKTQTILFGIWNIHNYPVQHDKPY